ncbi:uncharacterized protein LOC116351997 [Contarinia nasturtii]|uniref:uncharacterized protein LOC116351997 n=1 Tax=Contarinia nasturtii TaxID=265458 RepID=UPI0012D3C97C|nr:uncharacterized protein LOC116351997 [Contarinia nasturtii]
MSDCHQRFNHYCYICGKFIVMPNRRKISDEICKIYEQYFNIPVIRNEQWVPSIACTSCTNGLKRWSKGERESMPFGIPMVWIEPGFHDAANCYVCVNNVTGLNRFKARTFEYKSVPSAQTPLPHSEHVPIPKKPSPGEQYVPPTFESAPESSYSLHQPSNVTPPCKHIECTQNRLDIMARQLKLSQERQIMLTQHLKALNILAPGVKVYGARGRQREFMKFFDRNDENTFAYCNNIRGLMTAMGYEYNAVEWRLFIDASKSSLKAVLLYIDNTKSPIPLAISTKTEESKESMQKIIDAIKYDEHLWKVCADLKVVALLRGLPHRGYPKYMCFLCQWDTRHPNQYEKRDWPPRHTYQIGRQNVRYEPLIPMEKVLLAPLHIKLGIVKNFIKALVKRNNEQAFQRLIQIFPRLSKAKIKEGVLNGPDIRKLTKDAQFEQCLMEEEGVAWDNLKAFIEGVLGIHRAQNWRTLTDNMLDSFDILGVTMSLKIHFLHHHQDKLEIQASTESDEHGERFHQVTAQLEHWYSGKKLNSLLADLCWNLQMEPNDEDEN